MKNKRIFYSIDVECTDEDFHYYRKLHEPKGFQYEYVEDIEPIEIDVFEQIAEVINPNK